jgi:hypothetical protein
MLPWSGTMLIKALTLYSFPCVVVIAGSMATQQVISRDAVEGFGGAKAAIFPTEIVNRGGKSDRLPVERAQPRVNDKTPVRMQTDCKPLDVPGRCFAKFRMTQTAA